VAPYGGEGGIAWRLSQAQASALLDRMIAAKNEQPASDAQRRFMRVS